MKKLAGLAAFALATTLIGGLAPMAASAEAPASAKPEPTAAAERAATMDRYKQALAEQIARRLGDKTFRTHLEGELAGDGQAGLADLFASVSGAEDVAEYARRADGDILRLKGFGTAHESMLEVRSGPGVTKRIPADQTLVVFTPSADEKAVRSVSAYDSAGRLHQLDADKAPKRPVLIVGLDERKSAELSRQALRQALGKAGIGGTDRSQEEVARQSAALKTASATRTGGAAKSASATATRPVSVITRITNFDDHEPWYKGGPEIYAWVTGAGTDGKARVDSLEMPYIKEQDKDYRPGQVLIDWSNFSWSSLDVVWMEHDDNTDLSGLVKAVVDGALVVSGNGQYVQVADKIVAALPTDWVTDSDDWVDSCYAQNAQMTYGHCAARPRGMFWTQEYRQI
ncbi:DUF3103 family protein [Sphaerisporangium fuscum]|uniref:DUF3103 family protein n=1 Tax=Sphaerisporangium fuscum TaxID=2835868 RepID=UPI001BDC74FC|nr:DUF3103 family protein [Sphaerisporangium fuscum]